MQPLLKFRTYTKYVLSFWKNNIVIFGRGIGLYVLFCGGLTLVTPLPIKGGIMTQRFLTLAEVSDSLHTSVKYIKQLIENGKVKAIKSSKNFLISEFEYLKLIEAMGVTIDEK